MRLEVMRRRVLESTRRKGGSRDVVPKRALGRSVNFFADMIDLSYQQSRSIALLDLLVDHVEEWWD